MGTNYYWIPKEPCECCKRPYEPIHIGKSSAGWCFGLHVIPADEAKWVENVPETGINSLADWLGLWATGGEIVDENNSDISPAEMFGIIMNRCWPTRGNVRHDGIFRSQHSSPGPNGLLRHRIDCVFCIGHGEGTYDFLIGDFS